jgi:hypothetical protein
MSIQGLGGLGLVFSRLMLWAVVACLCWSSAAKADITFERLSMGDSWPVILLKGEFEGSDNPETLSREILSSGAKVVTFDSDGGNVVRAMAYGRMIRSLGVSTLQLRAAQCASACALAFVGGVNRYAEPGSIGVHQSSFSPESNIEGHMAVAAVQTLTAEIMSYLIEMEVDPKLLQLSLSVPSDDMRYLTASEMQNFKVTWGQLPAVEANDNTSKAAPPAAPPATENADSKVTSDEQKALTFVAAYHEAWSRRNSDALSFMENAYAETVDFYGKPTSKSVVLAEKRNFASRWPVRAYSVKAETTKVICRDVCNVTGTLDWYAKQDVGNRVSAGTAEFSLDWNPKTEKIISEVGKVIQTDKAASKPTRIIWQWEEENSLCRGGSGDEAKTLAACDRRELIGRKLETVGWCFGRESDYGYQMQWHACEKTSYRSEGVSVASSTVASFKKPVSSDFPARARFTGKTVLPDFKGRDRDFNNFRTRIRNGMRDGPNFAGHYSLIQIGCGTGCTFVVIADNNTGRPASFPRGGEDNMYLTLDYRRDSRLLAAQWLDSESDICVIEFFDFDRDKWTPISKTTVGGDDACYREIEENLPN